MKKRRSSAGGARFGSTSTSSAPLATREQHHNGIELLSIASTGPTDTLPGTPTTGVGGTSTLVVRELPWEELSEEEKAAIRWWQKLGLPVQAKHSDAWYKQRGFSEEHWGAADNINGPDHYNGESWCYRLAPQDPVQEPE